jgi:hypothetical protein
MQVHQKSKVTTLKRKRGKVTPPAPGNPAVSFHEQESLPSTNPSAHYYISTEVRHKTNILDWLGEHPDDPALQVSSINSSRSHWSLICIPQDFLPQLKNHLLARIIGLNSAGEEPEMDFTSAERNTITFVNNRLYRHKVLRVNYTTYDLRREQDSLNPRTHADIMVLSHEDEDSVHPYWYAHIIGIFHTVVYFKGLESYPNIESGMRQMEFLWVRWFGRDLTHKSGWGRKRLHRVGFIDSEDPAAFGFLDARHVIRGVHMIPAFQFGLTDELLPPSIARLPSDNDEDWRYYYVAM